MRFRLSAFLVALICSIHGLAAPPAADQKAAAPRQAGLPDGIGAERDILYIPGGDPAQSLDLYLPTKPGDKPLPLIVWIHGGGWQGGRKAGCPAMGFVADGYAA